MLPTLEQHDGAHEMHFFSTDDASMHAAIDDLQEYKHLQSNAMHQCIDNPMLCRRPLRTQLHGTPSDLKLPLRSRGIRQADQLRHQPRTVRQTAVRPVAFDTGDRDRVRLPTQGESVVRGTGNDTRVQELPKPPADIDYLAVCVSLGISMAAVCKMLDKLHCCACRS